MSNIALLFFYLDIFCIYKHLHAAQAFLIKTAASTTGTEAFRVTLVSCIHMTFLYFFCFVFQCALLSSCHAAAFLSWYTKYVSRVTRINQADSFYARKQRFSRFYLSERIRNFSGLVLYCETMGI